MMEIISFNNNIYVAYRRIREDHLQLIPNAIEEVKTLWRCDTALKKGDFIYFCRLIEDAVTVDVH